MLGVAWPPPKRDFDASISEFRDGSRRAALASEGPCVSAKAWRANATTGPRHAGSGPAIARAGQGLGMQPLQRALRHRMPFARCFSGQQEEAALVAAPQHLHLV